MHPTLEQGYCKEILAKLATCIDGMSYDELKGYIRGRPGSRRHFEATFTRSLLDVLIHAPFDFRTVDGVNRIVRSASAPAELDAAPTDGPADPRVAFEMRAVATPRAATALDDGERTFRDAMLAELPPGTSKHKSAWRRDTRNRDEVADLGLDDLSFKLVFDTQVTLLLAGGEVEVDPAAPGGPDRSYRRTPG